MGLLGVSSAMQGQGVAATPATASCPIDLGEAPAVVFVDGIRGFGTGLVPERMRDVNYLSTATIGARMRALTESYQESHGLSGCVDDLVWQGTFLIHPEDKIDAVERVRRLIDSACRRSSNVNVIAHSQGAELAYIALSQLSTGNRPVHPVKNLFTLGSYLKFTSLWHPRRALTPAAAGVAGLWVNVHAEGDPIGGAMSGAGVMDVRLTRPSGPSDSGKPSNFEFVRCHRWPYEDPATIGMIERVIKGEVRDQGAIEAHYRQSDRTINRPFTERIWGAIADPFRFVADAAAAGWRALRSAVGA